MGVQVENGLTLPALEYDRVHLESLKIYQPLLDNDNAQALYSLKITYRLYTVDPETKTRYYDNTNICRVDIPDVLAAAGIKAQQGDMSLFMALGAIEQALAQILISEGRHGNVETY